MKLSFHYSQNISFYVFKILNNLEHIKNSQNIFLYFFRLFLDTIEKKLGKHLKWHDKHSCTDYR